MRRQEPAERSRHICGTSLESSMLLVGNDEQRSNTTVWLRDYVY